MIEAKYEPPRVAIRRLMRAGIATVIILAGGIGGWRPRRTSPGPSSQPD